MQCVKLRSVMGSYLNIHLNLSPVYVLLLLLTLSHGRPSARIREPFSNHIAAFSPFPSATFPLSNSSLDFRRFGVHDGFKKSVSKQEHEHMARDSSKSFQDDINDEVSQNKVQGTRSSNADWLEGINVPTFGGTNINERKFAVNPVQLLTSEDTENRMGGEDSSGMASGARREEDSRGVLDESSSSEESEDEEQLEKFRRNILKELGFDETDEEEDSKRVARSTTSRYPNIPASNITPKVGGTSFSIVSVILQIWFQPLRTQTCHKCTMSSFK